MDALPPMGGPLPPSEGDAHPGEGLFLSCWERAEGPCRSPVASGTGMAQRVLVLCAISVRNLHCAW